MVPKMSKQNQKSTATPRSSRGGTCLAAGGKWGITEKYKAFPASTAISDWTKLTTAGLDTVLTY
jgi:hypothetical protein